MMQIARTNNDSEAGRNAPAGASSPAKPGRRTLRTIYTKATLAYITRRHLLARAEGQALIEYALIVSLVALASIAALTMTGNNIHSLLNKVAGEV